MLTNRVALVTGAARGLGEAIARVMAKEGAQVAVTDLDPKACQTVIDSLDNPAGHLAAEVNVTSKSSINEAVKQIQDKYSRPPDIIVNSAGITMDKYLLRMSEETFDKVIEVNLKGTYLVNQIAASALKEADLQGSIVNISSVVGKTGNVGQANYTASKAGVIAFTKTASKELGKFGIRVNCICPGPIRTPMTDKVPEEHKIVFAKRRTALKRYGHP